MSQEKSRRSRETSTIDDVLRRIGTSQMSPEQIDMRSILRDYQLKRERTIFWRKWGGRVIMVFGIIVLLPFAPLYLLGLTPWLKIGYTPLVVALGLIGGGYALSKWKPRLKATNEALLVAMKFGNRLTAPRLALEFDCTIDKAEKILQELVRTGVAEIELNQKDPSGAITYVIKGL